MSLGDAYARAMAANAAKPAYAHNQNYDWHCPEHMTEWKGDFQSHCWIEGCEVQPITKHRAIVLAIAARDAAMGKVTHA